MAWSIVQHVLVTDNATPTTGVDTTGADLIVICQIQHSITTAGAAPTDSKSNTWTQLFFQPSVSSRDAMQAWYSHNPTVGSGHTFTCTVPAFGQFSVIAFSGSGSGSIVDQTNTGNFAGDNVTTTEQQPSITTTQAGDLVVAYWGVDDGVGGVAGRTPGTVNQSFTILDSADVQVGARYGMIVSYFFQGAAATVNPTWTALVACESSPNVRNDAMGIGSFKGPASSFTWLDMGVDAVRARRYRMVGY